MKYRSILFLFCFFMVSGLYAKENNFEIPVLYNIPGTHTTDKGLTQFLIGHRSNIGITYDDNLLGLDSGLNLFLGVDVGLPYHSMLGLSRSSTKRVYNLYGKIKASELLFNDNYPLAQAVYFSFSLPRSDGFEKDLKYNVALINSKLFFEKLEVTLPLYASLFSNDLINIAVADKEHTIAVGLGIRFLVIESLFAVGEFVTPVIGHRNYIYYLDESRWYPYYSLSLQYLIAYGHFIQLGVSNGYGMLPEEYIGGGDNKVKAGLTIGILF